ncbi:flagellin N-terminal helical domain-containing protein [Salinicola sp. NYA28a]
MAVINTNITSLIGQNNLNKSQSALSTAMERLSSGSRINSAKDDAAGQAIANRMSSQITGLAQAQRNANDGISVAQTTEGALNQVNDNLQRIRELAVQAQNGTNSDDDLESIQNEIGQRLGEINRISDETSFNGVNVLQSDNSLKIQVGANDGETITIDLKQINAETLGLTGFNVDGSGEIANDAATAEDLDIAGFEKADSPSANGSYAWSKTETTGNLDATVADVLGKAETGDKVTATALTNNGTGTAAVSGAYTYSADSDSFSFDAAGVSNEDTIAYMTQGMSSGEMRTASVDIDGSGTAQEIKYDSEGNVFAADDNAALYLDSTGNLTKNSAGSPPAATLENLSDSMTLGAGTQTSTVTATATTNGDSTAINEAQTYAFGALAEGESITVAGRTLTATGAMTDADVANAFQDQFAAASDVTVGTAGTAGSFTMAGTAASGWEATASGNDTVLTYTADFTDQDDLTPQKTTLGAATGGTISFGDTTLTADGGNGFDIGNAEISSANLGSQIANGDSIAIGYGSDPDVTYNVGASGAITSGGVAQHVQADGSLGAADETTATTTYYAHENGNVTDVAGGQVYKNDDGEITMDAVTEGTRTEDPLKVLDNALSQVDTLRSDLGAIQNRFDSAIENLSTSTTNLSAARSRIEDADYAVEVSNMTRAQILQQAGTSVLAQANQVPQGVLSLLG